ncbi:MAG: aminodeoxychorismate lyase, partial [Alphaproteobacteria bacterium]
MRRVVVRVVLILAAVITILAGAIIWFSAAFDRPGPLAAGVTVIIPRGAGVEEIADLLHRDRVIANPLVFSIGVRLGGGEK